MTPSSTVVGDLAQTGAPWGAGSWARLLDPQAPGRWRVEQLTVNYRTPSQIAEAAVRMANAAGLVVSAPKAVREGQWSPIIDRVDLENVLCQVDTHGSNLFHDFPSGYLD